MTLHVVQALAALSVGGSELVAAELTEDLRRRGHRVSVLAAPGPLSARIADSGAELLPWPVNRKRLGTLGQVARIRNWLLEVRPDVLHLHSRLPAWLCWLALRSLPPEQRPVLVTTVHGHYSISRYSSIMTRGDAVIAVSRAIREYTLHHYPVDPGRVQLIHGGVDRRAFPHGYRPDSAWYESVCTQYPQLRGRRWLLLPGRLSRYKGHTELVRLVATLAMDTPDIQGVIVGAGRSGSRYGDELAGLARSMQAEDRITMVGVRSDIRDWMAASSLVLSLCSDPPEAFGRTVLEALSLGRPVVGWNHGGVAEILAALYPFGAVPPRNFGALLAQTRTLLHRPPPVEAGTAFSLQSSMDQTHALYQQLLAARHNPDSRA